MTSLARPSIAAYFASPRIVRPNIRRRNPRDSWPAWTDRDRWSVAHDGPAGSPAGPDPAPDLGDPSVLYRGINHRVVAAELPGGGPGCEVQTRWKGGWLPALIFAGLDKAIEVAIAGDADPDLSPDAALEPDWASMYPDFDPHHPSERVEAQGCFSGRDDAEYARLL